MRLANSQVQSRERTKDQTMPSLSRWFHRVRETNWELPVMVVRPSHPEPKYFTAKPAKIACLRAERTGRQRVANSHQAGKAFGLIHEGSFPVACRAPPHPPLSPIAGRGPGRGAGRSPAACCGVVHSFRMAHPGISPPPSRIQRVPWRGLRFNRVFRAEEPHDPWKQGREVARQTDSRPVESSS